MISTLRAVCVLALLVIASTAGAEAQSVHGILTDADHGRPIPDARLYLLGVGGTIADSTLTDAQGGFRLAADTAGVYHVHFQIDGWASMSAPALRLDEGTDVDLAFPVQLVPIAVLRQMSDMIGMDERLQTSLPEICGEALRPWEAGLLVGIVRSADNEPVAGARVAVATLENGIARATLSADNGIYILCNVPLGPAVQISVDAPDGTRETTEVEIRAGMVSWYDLPLGHGR